MEEFLSRNKLDTARETILSRLSLKDLLNLKRTLRGFDSSFSIVDVKGELHIFESLTPENIKKGREILKELNQELILVSKDGLLEKVRNLLAHPDIDVNAREKWGATASLFASLYGHPEILRELLRRPEIDADAHKIALNVASMGGQTEIVKLLLNQEEIDVNTRDENGRTPLMYASMQNHIEIVRLLLDQIEIDVNAQDQSGDTALEYASRQGCQEIVQLLQSDPRILR